MPTRSVTLTANEVTTVTIPGDWQAVAVFVPDAAGATVHVSVTDTDPTPYGDDTFAVPGGARRTIAFGGSTGRAVRLISTGGPQVEVEFA
jgi:hypothetical protein